MRSERVKEDSPRCRSSLSGGSCPDFRQEYDVFFVATCGEPLGLLMLTTHSSGEEIVYAIEGLLEYQIDGRPPVTLKAGEVLFIPAGAVHAVKNVGSGNAAELATYIVEKGKPLVVPVK